MAKDDKKYFRAHFDSIYYDFYRTLVAATQNIVFSHLTYSLDEIFSAAFPYPRQALVNVPRISTVIYLQHRDIWKAIAARNPQAASKSVNKHFDYIESKLRELAEGLDDVQDERP
jgi:DNA-binding FadR family transcriptional regulator